MVPALSISSIRALTSRSTQPVSKIATSEVCSDSMCIASLSFSRYSSKVDGSINSQHHDAGQVAGGGSVCGFLPLHPRLMLSVCSFEALEKKYVRNLLILRRNLTIYSSFECSSSGSASPRTSSRRPTTVRIHLYAYPSPSLMFAQFILRTPTTVPACPCHRPSRGARCPFPPARPPRTRLRKRTGCSTPEDNRTRHRL